MGPIRLLVADVDGTLLTDAGVLTARARGAVERLRAAGVQLGLVSEWPPRALASLVQMLKVTTPLIAFSGGMLVDPHRGEVLEQRTLPLAVATELVDRLEAAGLEVWVYRGLDWFVGRAGTAQITRERHIVGLEPTVLADLRGVLEGAVKIVGLSDDAHLVARCEAELRLPIGVHTLVTRPEAHRVEFMDPEANRATGLRLSASHLGVPLDEVAALGDTSEDALMFGLVGTSIAMGNASPEVQRAAWHVTTSNEAEGFAKAIEWFILGEPGATRPMLGLPSRTQACLFDLDGVLTQTAKLHAVAWKHMFDEYLEAWSKSHGQPFVPFDAVTDYTLYVDGRLRVDGARSFLASRGIRPPEDEVEALAQRKDKLLVELLHTEHVETYDGSIRFVRAVRAAGLRTAVVSASRHCADVLASSGISDLFDVRIDGVVAARDHLAGKPAPDTFLAAAHAVGVDPLRAAVFEDALSGVEAGRAGHFGYVVGVDRAHQALELRRHGADIVVTDLAALMVPR